VSKEKATLAPLCQADGKLMSEILVPVSFGELLDKISILQIKSERINDPARQANVNNELRALERTWAEHPAAKQDISDLRDQLKAVTRQVYIRNDERARIKKAINLALGSHYVEEKSYQDYGVG